MRRWITPARASLAAVILMLLVVPAGRGQAPRAAAALRDGKDHPIGSATFTQSLPGGGVWIEVSVHGLPPGVHGINIHENGVCQGPDFTSAGADFNPLGHPHGLAHREGAHAGDMPNLIVGEDGRARYESANYRITIDPGPKSILKSGGTSLVIHARADDQLTDPEGNSGPRIACGVITPAP